MDAVHTPNLSDIRVDLIELKKAIKVLTRRVDVSPLPPLHMPSLEALTVYVNSLVLEIYTPALDIDEINIKKVRGKLKPQKR